ncbi:MULTISPECIES: hypothetical protein [Paenibacillus]|uniref:hypothetical protein n=1 Tax=Paenibacillus TaxID=44249 RepID=UPI000B84A71D|nr:hypothetical protein [Paenibacillus amylolyticus]
MDKQCKDCGKTKDIESFYHNKKLNKHNQSYYHPECKDCTKLRTKTWRSNNPDRQRENNNRRDRTPKRIAEKRLHAKRPESKKKQKEWRESDFGKKYMSQFGKQRNEVKKHSISKEEWVNCKNYFNYECAYCGLKSEHHLVMYRGLEKIYDFCKDHFEDSGSNFLDNCIPACRKCNSSKWTFDFEEWYRNYDHFDEKRYRKIVKWIVQDHKQYILNNNNFKEE